MNKDNNLPSRVLAIHDICGIGRCSLVSAISILSHLGNTVCPLATSSFSTNTSFNSFQWEDLSDTLFPFLEDFKTKNISFQSIYSGYLGNEKQTQAILKAIEYWPNAFKLIDPVFGDGGKLFGHFNLSIVDSFKELIKKADLITPNLTESSFLLSHKPDQINNIKEAKEALKILSEDKKKSVVITSVEDPSLEGKIGVVAYDKNKDQILEFFSDKRESVTFCGTGDVMTSVLLGLILSGHSFEDSLNLSFNFIKDSIDYTLEQKGISQEGIIFEPLLRKLL